MKKPPFLPYSKLEIPSQERLLPIGHVQSTSGDGNIKELVEKVREVLGVMSGKENSIA